LTDPERCGACKVRARVFKSVRRPHWRYRRHACPRCGARWSSWQSRMNPARIVVRAVT